MRQAIADHGALTVIPTKPNVPNPIAHDKVLYTVRKKTEGFFCKLKDMRKLATRFEKRTKTSARLSIYSVSK